MADLDLRVKVLEGSAEGQLKDIIAKLEKNRIQLRVDIKDNQLHNLKEHLAAIEKSAKGAAGALNSALTGNAAFKESRKIVEDLKARKKVIDDLAEDGSKVLNDSAKKKLENHSKWLNAEITKQEAAMKRHVKNSGNLSNKAIHEQAKLMASSQKAINKSFLLDDEFGSVVFSKKAEKARETQLNKSKQELEKTLTTIESSLFGKKKGLSNYFGKHKDLINLDEFTKLRTEAEGYFKDYNRLVAEADRLKVKMANKTASPKEVDRARAISDEMRNLGHNIDNVQKRMDTFIAPTRQAENAALAYDKLGSRLTDYYNKYGNQLQKNMGLQKKWNELFDRANNRSFSSVAEANREFAAFRTQARMAGVEIETFGSKLQKAFGAKLRSQMSYYGFMAMEMALRDILQNAKAVDTAMTELKKVTSETDATYTQFLEGAEQRAQKLGATLSEVVNATADYARLGYNIDQATTLADSALIYSNVGDDVNGIDNATAALISTMQGFNIAAADSMSIVDKFNNVSNNYASSAGDIGEIVKRSAASMSAAGNTLDQTIALGVAANEVQQDSDTVGTALKTMSMRLRGSKTDLEAAGLDAEGMASSVSKLREEMISLSGVDIMLNDDTFKSSYDILMGIGEVWDSLSDINRANITELLFGKRQTYCLDIQRCVS